jgi:hypothetical protein
VINITKKIRTAYYTALNGVISVPVVDGWDMSNGMVEDHVIIKNIQEVKQDRTQQTYGAQAIVELDIVTYMKNGFTSDTRDDIEGEILAVLKPTINTNGLTVTGIGLYNVEKEGSNDIDEISPSGNVLRKILRISQFIQQN